jgi:hypothetical protein
MWFNFDEFLLEASEHWYPVKRPWLFLEQAQICASTNGWVNDASEEEGTFAATSKTVQSAPITH